MFINYHLYSISEISEGKSLKDTEAKLASVKAAQKFFSEDRERGFEAKVHSLILYYYLVLMLSFQMMDEYARLLAFQQQLERESPTETKFVGLSVNETIKTCIVNNIAKKADKIKSDWKVSDKRCASTQDQLVITLTTVCSYWNLKLQALVEMKDFEALEIFARSKKSPIGYEPFVKMLLENGHEREAVSFVPRCDANRRIDLYIECGDWRAAGKECKERGNKARLE